MDRQEVWFIIVIIAATFLWLSLPGQGGLDSDDFFESSPPQVRLAKRP